MLPKKSLGAAAVTTGEGNTMGRKGSIHHLCPKSSPSRAPPPLLSRSRAAARARGHRTARTYRKFQGKRGDARSGLSVGCGILRSCWD